jgi:glycosyltransferase involved in cell wall biosynthesis
VIRVLHFNHIIHPYDVVDTALSRIDQSKFDLRALTGQLAPPAGEYRAGANYKIRCLDFPFSQRTYLRMFRSLVDEIRRFRPQVLHAHGFNENLIAALAVRYADVPCYILGRHYSDHIYFLTQGMKQRAFLAAEGFSNRTATKIIVPTRSVATLLTDRQRVPASKVVQIPFGLDFDKYRPSSPTAPAHIRAVLGFQDKYMAVVCGRINPEKGLDYILRALPIVLKRNPDFRLVLVGSGPYEDELRRQGRELGVESIVTYAGWRTDAMDWIAAADLIVHAAFCESWCQVLFEALAFGKPIVMTPVGAAPEVIGANERGRLIPIGDSGAIAEAILELMNDPESAWRMGQKGKEYIFCHLGAEQTARKYENLYTELL